MKDYFNTEFDEKRRDMVRYVEKYETLQRLRGEPNLELSQRIEWELREIES